MIRKINHRWGAKGGYKEVLLMAIPLILSTGALSIQHFVDRMFLTWYSPEAIAASVPSGILNFTILSLFIGTASYVSTFVAQYLGSGQFRRMGEVVWQGIFFSLSSLPVMLIFIPLSDPIFSLIGHEPGVMELETRYFVILCMGGVFPVVSAALGGFFSGLGSTWVVMWANLTGTLINIVLDYLLIFGRFGFPEMGITGAALATVIAGIITMLLFFLVLFSRRIREPYFILEGFRVKRMLLFRLIKFGFPNGVQFFLDMMGFTIFILLVGRYGKIELAATNIAFNINSLAFMPMIGFGIAISVMVGQNLGDGNPDEAEFATWSGAQMTLVYMITISACYLLFPRVFLSPFGMKGDPEVYNQIMDYGIVLLRFIAFFSVFDTFTIIFASAIKGAGDTKFVMKAIVTASWTILVIPTFLAVIVFEWHLYVTWIFATVYVTVLAFIFLIRFMRGSWKTMLVIERQEDEVLLEMPKSAVS
jgi:MATE family, multidrug efflux pump